MRERDGRTRQSGGTDSGHEAAATPGKSTLTAGLTVQRHATSAASPPPGAVQDAAARGTATPITAMPHADRIQASFGPAHDVSSIQAHVGGGAAAACADMGASAFASGSHVAFAQAPDLHTAAHEAAHVVQQAQGVNLYGGVGAAGDSHEQHADAVADRVVAGHSVADLFGPTRAASSGSGVQQRAVQRQETKVSHEGNLGEGKVTARENDVSPGDATKDKYSLEYAGKDADKGHWLQFVNFTMYADTPTGKVYYTGSVGTTSGTKPFSTDKVTNWSVDSASASDPYYEAGFVSSRDPGKNTKIFDKPGGASINGFAAQLVATKAPTATKVTFIAAFDTYLVVDGKSTYHVPWSATTEYDPAKKTSAAIAYATGAAGAAVALPKNLKTVLDTQYAGNKIQ